MATPISPRRIHTGRFQGHFAIYDGEAPTDTDNKDEDLPASTLSPHERALLQRAHAFQDKKQMYVVVDREAQEVRFGPDVVATREGTPGAEMERVYFHQLRSAIKRSNDTVRMKTASGLDKTFVGKQAQELFDSLDSILNPPRPEAVVSAKPPATPATSPESPQVSVMVMAVPLFTVAMQIVAAHALFSPFTKVEESFNVQAVHDLIRYPEGLHNRSIIRQKYDHIEFPGVVPRTFIGALGLASIYDLVDNFIPRAALQDGIVDLVALRLIMGLCFMMLSVAGLYHASRRAFPQTLVPVWYMLLQFSQFHVPFYSTRLLPNTFAMITCSLAHAQLLRGNDFRAISLLILTAVIFRCDVLVLLAPTAVAIWLRLSAQRGLSTATLLTVGFRMLFWALANFAFFLAATVMLDTHMWDKDWTDFFWPEGIVLFFNTVLNKSSEWGTEPYHWYFSSALPRALLLSFPLIPIGIVAGRSNARFMTVALPSLTFVLLYSVLPHKEVRFLFPVLPALTLTAAVGFDGILKRTSTKLRSVLTTVFVLACLGSLWVSMFYSFLSSKNYPSGYALQWLHRNGSGPSPIRVHIDPYSAMSGISRFGYLVNSDRFLYSKKEHDIQYNDYDYLIDSNPAKVVSLTNDAFKIIHSEMGEPKVVFPTSNKLKQLLASPPSTAQGLFSAFIQTRPVVFVLQKRSNEESVKANVAEEVHIPSTSAY